MESIAPVKCISTNAPKVGREEEELEAQENCAMWAWWKRGGMGHIAYKPSRRDQQGGKGGSGVVLSVGECLGGFKMFNVMMRLGVYG